MRETGYEKRLELPLGWNMCHWSRSLKYPPSFYSGLAKRIISSFYWLRTLFAHWLSTFTLLIGPLLGSDRAPYWLYPIGSGHALS